MPNANTSTVEPQLNRMLNEAKRGIRINRTIRIHKTQPSGIRTSIPSRIDRPSLTRALSEEHRFNRRVDPTKALDQISNPLLL